MKIYKKLLLMLATVFLLTMAFCLIVTAEAQAATYYVSPDGDDSRTASQAQNPSTPWEHCPGMAGWTGLAQLNAGDTVYFNSSGTWTLNSGSRGLWVKGGVTYIGDSWGGGTRAKFDATKSYGQKGAVILIVKDHPTLPTVVKGFEVDGNDKESRGIAVNNGYGVDSDGAVKRIENCHVHHTGVNTYVYGIHVSVTTNTTVRNVEILNNIVHDTPRSVITLYAGYESNNAHIYDVTIRGNESYGGYVDTVTGGAGLLVKHHVENLLVEENYFHDNKNGIIIERIYENASPPKNITVRNNIIRSGNASGVYVQAGPSQNVHIYNNLIFNNSKYGINFESNLHSTLSYYVYGNTIYNNSLGNIRIADSSAYFSTLAIRNNILYPTGISGDTGKITTQSNNLTSNPNFKNTSNLPTGFTGTHNVDIRPDRDGLSVELGPAIDGGVDLGATYNRAVNPVIRSSEWDIGAYEYVEIAKPKPTPIVGYSNKAAGLTATGSDELTDPSMITDGDKVEDEKAAESPKAGNSGILIFVVISAIVAMSAIMLLKSKNVAGE